MATVRMYVEKFGREVIIDSEHPWAIAQRALDAAKAAASKANATPSPSTDGGRTSEGGEANDAQHDEQQNEQSGSGDVISVSGGADLAGRRHPTAPQSDERTADAKERAPKSAAKRSRRKKGDA